MPIFVAHDSADVWAQRELFLLDAEGHPTVVAGVPPDYFSETGQRWGNPHYNWPAMQADGFAWWRARLAAHFEWFDLVRIDHFRGLQAAWVIPAHEATAIHGEWVKAPGAALLQAIADEMGELPLVAEDLGIITPDVTALRHRFGLPGMAVLQFAFDHHADNPHKPENVQPDTVYYTGTHDNDTTLGVVARAARRCAPAGDAAARRRGPRCGAGRDDRHGAAKPRRAGDPAAAGCAAPRQRRRA
jgi:4-alpha-glucanotransferase